MSRPSVGAPRTIESLIPWTSRALEGIGRCGSTRVSSSVRPASSTIATSTIRSPLPGLSPVVSVSRKSSMTSPSPRIAKQQNAETEKHALERMHQPDLLGTPMPTQLQESLLLPTILGLREGIPLRESSRGRYPVCMFQDRIRHFRQANGAEDQRSHCWAGEGSVGCGRRYRPRRSRSLRLLLPMLHSEHRVWRFSSSSVPPFERGLMWSTCSTTPPVSGLRPQARQR